MMKLTLPILHLLGRLMLAFGLCLAPTGTLLASPGAHGPNGEHLDGPVAMASAAELRFETHSELFEIVGRLEPAALVFYVSRYESNQPVLDAKLEVELGALKAMAAYLAADGTYQVTDKALLAELSKAGRHAMVLTLLAGSESDLLDATLTIASAAKVPAGSAWRSAAGLAALLAVLLGAALLLWRRRSRRLQRSGAFL
jgi:hypothetical protein